MWKTGGPVFPLKRGLVAGRASDRKNKNAMSKKCRLSAVATPNQEKPKEKEKEEVNGDFSVGTVEPTALQIDFIFAQNIYTALEHKK